MMENRGSGNGPDTRADAAEPFQPPTGAGIGPPVTPPLSEQARAELTKKLRRAFLGLTLIMWGLSVFVTFAWWLPQGTGRSGGPRGSFSDGAMFPWPLVMGFAVVGLWAFLQAVRGPRRQPPPSRQLPN
jgi:hypothetical protein